MERFIPELLTTLENAVTVEQDKEGNMVVIRPEAKYMVLNQDEKGNGSIQNLTFQT